jgi:hypothetical protein
MGVMAGRTGKTREGWLEGQEDAEGRGNFRK